MQHLKHNMKLSPNTISRAAHFSKQKGVLLRSIANDLYSRIPTVNFMTFMSYPKGKTSRRIRYFSILKVLLSQSWGPWKPKEGMDHAPEALQSLSLPTDCVFLLSRASQNLTKGAMGLKAAKAKAAACTQLQRMAKLTLRTSPG